MEQIYRNKYNIYNHLFYNVYYDKIGKKCFTPQWRCVSYMEIAPLLHRSHFGYGQRPVHEEGPPHYEEKVEIERTSLLLVGWLQG